MSVTSLVAAVASHTDKICYKMAYLTLHLG